MKTSDIEFLKATSSIFSGIAQLLSCYTDSVNQVAELKTKVANLNIEISELTDLRAKAECELSYFKYQLSSNIKTEADPGSSNPDKIDIGFLKQPAAQKQHIKLWPTGFCELCGNKVENPKHRFCSRSCQVKQTHVNRRLVKNNPDQQPSEPAAEKEDNTQP